MPQPKFGPYSDYQDPYVLAQQNFLSQSPISNSSSSQLPGANKSGWSSFASVLANVLGSIVTSYISYRNQENVNAQNRWLANHQNELNIAQWQRENSFNSPLAQIQRLRAAGLNPGLLMSSGIENVAAQSPQMVTSQGRASAQFSNPFSQFASDIKTAELMDAQRENIEADTALKLADAGLTEVRKNIAGVELTIKLKNGEKLSDLAVQSLEKSIEKMNSEIDNISADTAVKILEEKKIRFEVEHLLPEQLNNLVSKTGLNLAQAKEILELLPTKILLNKAMASNNFAQGRLANANAEFQEKLAASDEYVQQFIKSVRVDNMGKLVSLAIEAGQNQNALRVGGSTLGIHGLYKQEYDTGDEALTNTGEVLSMLGRLFSFIVKS